MNRQTRKVLIKCDFPNCGQEFNSTVAWERHYVNHGSVKGYLDFYEASREGGRTRLMATVASRPGDLIEPGLRIVGKNQPILEGKVDLVGFDSRNTLCLIDVSMNPYTGPKVAKLLRYRGYLHKMGFRIFKLDASLRIRCFIVTERGVVEVGK